MQLRRGYRLLLKHEARAKLHLAADAKRVDALVPCRLPCSWPKDLPLIRFASLVERLLRLPGCGESQQVESSIGVDVGNVKYPSRTDRLRQRSKLLRAVTEPH